MLITARKKGRPPKYSQTIRQEICGTIMQSNKGTKRLCKQNQHWPCQDTLFEWLKNDYEFSEQYKASKMIQFYDLADEVWDIATGIELVEEGKDKAKRNRAILHRAKLQMGVRMWTASRLFARVYTM